MFIIGVEEFSKNISFFRVNKFSPGSLRNYSPEFYRKNDERINKLSGKSPDYLEYLKEGHKFEKRARSGGDTTDASKTQKEFPDISAVDTDRMSGAKTTVTWRQTANMRKTVLQTFNLTNITEEKKAKIILDERKKSFKTQLKQKDSRSSSPKRLGNNPSQILPKSFKKVGTTA